MTVRLDGQVAKVTGAGMGRRHAFTLVERQCSSGMNGSCLAATALIEGKRRGMKYIVTTMCVGGSMAAASLFEVA